MSLTEAREPGLIGFFRLALGSAFCPSVTWTTRRRRSGEKEARRVLETVILSQKIY